MSLLGGIVGGAAKIGAGIFGGIAKARAMRRVRKSLEKEGRENEEDYNREYNQDYTQSAPAQQVLTALKGNQKQLADRVAGSAAVMGGTDEGAALARAAANSQTADVLSNLAAAGEQRRQAVKSAYRSRKAAINKALREMDIAKANNINTAMQGVADAAGGLATGIEDYVDAKRTAGDSSLAIDWNKDYARHRKALGY